MSIEASMREKLSERFQPERMDVINESHLHAGHQPGFTGSGETHFRVRIVSAAFAGLSRVERHRALNEVLKPEIDAGVHALALEPAAPGEPTRW